MRKLLLFICFVLNISVFAQRKQGNVPPPMYSRYDKMHIVDTAYINIYYAFNAKNIIDESTYVDMHWLQIGKRLIKYSSYALAQNDSAGAEWKKTHPKAQSIPLKISKKAYFDINWSEYTYDELYIQDGKLTEYALFPMSLGRNSCYYTEDYPMQKWQISTETKILRGYKCQKATCSWRGREYVAWFTMEIPKRLGPWKFGGLPGLIIKVSDLSDEYSFECVRIEKANREINTFNYSKFKKVERNEMLSIQKKLNVNWQKTLGITTTVGQSIMKDIPYSPLELK